jgi:methyltransferase family protein/C-methyltransferase-like protein
MNDRCPVCREPEVAKLLSRDSVPVLMHRLYASRERALDAVRAPLDLVACLSCGFVWNRSFDPSKIDYDVNYENSQNHSDAFREHLSERAEAILCSACNEEGINYLEIGCGQGEFMESFVSRAGPRLQNAEGFDPTWRGADETGPAGSSIHKMYFDTSSSERLSCAPNIVVTRHTIEHVPKPVEFLTSIRDALGARSRAAIYVETPDVRWILENLAIQDFVYEHCSLFSAEALAVALQLSGFERPTVTPVFGGQYLWAKATAGARDSRRDYSRVSAGLAIENVEGDVIGEWRKRVVSARQEGPVAVWGAGAKGVTFAFLVDPDASLLDHAIDINPLKQEHFLPGTGLPVISPESSATRKPRTVFVMNPNYLSEIRMIAERAGILAEFIPIN